MKRYNKNLGDFGEDCAESYLRDRGYEILERNYTTNSGEIDIVAMDENILVFAEVKTRSSRKFGSPAEAVDKNKMKHMRLAAEKYYSENPLDVEVRFDVIEVIASFNGDIPLLGGINHIKDVILEWE